MTSSPKHAKSNGKAESAVKVAKKIFKKAHRDNKDPWLALLDQRNTPTQGVNSSPVQRLMSRRTRTLLPVSANLLYPRVEKGVKEMWVSDVTTPVKVSDTPQQNLSVPLKSTRTRIVNAPVRFKDYAWASKPVMDTEHETLLCCCLFAFIFTSMKLLHVQADIFFVVKCILDTCHD